jgi:prepilin-type N-terminal cleavage/methylation domain-containing protein
LAKERDAVSWTEKKKNGWADHRGMTLVEMMVALAIFGVAMTVLFSFLVNSRRNYTSVSQRVEYQQSVRAVLSLISQEVRSAGCNPAGASFDPFRVAHDRLVQFRRDLDGDGVIEVSTPAEDIFYFYQPFNGWLWRRGEGGAWQVILRDLDNLTFSFFDADGSQLGPGWLSAQEMDRIRYVEVNIAGETDRGGPVNYTTRVFVRNG